MERKILAQKFEFSLLLYNQYIKPNIFSIVGHIYLWLKDPGKYYLLMWYSQWYQTIATQDERKAFINGMVDWYINNKSA